MPFEGLPARIAWLGHGERTELALAVNRMVRDGDAAAPIAFTRDHLDAGAMAHPNIMTENMRDGSDAIADWPLLNAMVNCASQADLVAIHSGGGGYAGYMTSAGVTLIADGSDAADERLSLRSPTTPRPASCAMPMPDTRMRWTRRSRSRSIISVWRWLRRQRGGTDDRSEHARLSGGVGAVRRAAAASTARSIRNSSWARCCR